jgi:hypothetical protein
MDPRVYTASLVFESGAKLSHDKCIRDKIQCEHKDPTEDYLDSVKIHKTVYYISKAPDCGKRHHCHGIPFDFLVV